MSTTHTIRALCPFGLDGIAVEITYTFTKGAPATRIDPADPAETDFVSVKPVEGKLDPLWQHLLDDWARDWVGDEGFPACCQQAGYDSGDSYD